MDFSIKELTALIRRKCNPRSNSYMTDVLAVIDDYIDRVEINDEFYIQHDKLVSVVENREFSLPTIIAGIVVGAAVVMVLDSYHFGDLLKYAVGIASGFVTNFLLVRIFLGRRNTELYPYIIKRMQEKVEEESLQELL